MRCPKCGYTSFDHLESCKKCHKSFGPADEEFNGTTYEAVAPLFLKIARDLEEPPSTESVQELDFDDIDLDDELEEEQGNTLRPGIDTEFTLDEDILAEATKPQEALADDGEELVVDLDEMEEVSPRDEFTLDFDQGPGDDENSELPPIDFGDLDISDLGPPMEGEEIEEEPEEVISLEQEELSFSEEPIMEEIVEANVAEPPPAPKPTKQAGKTGLEDLNFNGLDLESPSKIVSGSAAGKRYLPSVKTGTALDKFDIDLGDLFKDNKK